MLQSSLANLRVDLRGKAGWSDHACFAVTSASYTPGVHQLQPISAQSHTNACSTCRAHVDLASVEVRFKHLSVSAEVAVGARGEPTVWNAYRNQFEVSNFMCISAGFLCRACHPCQHS